MRQTKKIKNKNKNTRKNKKNIKQKKCSSGFNDSKKYIISLSNISFEVIPLEILKFIKKLAFQENISIKAPKSKKRIEL